MATFADATTRSDSEVREDVIDEFDWNPQIASTDIGVSVTDGVVTLSGFVSSFMEKDAAERAAKRVRGVRGIANDLDVKLGSSRTDPEIARDVVQGVANHASLPADKIKVTVRNGWVTLDGTLSWQYQKNLAENSAKKLRGVIGITDNITLEPKVSTTEVKAKIEEAIRRNAQIDAGRVTVETDGTTVRLSGAVQSWAEKEEAEQAAWSAPGVRYVDNRIAIASTAEPAPKK